MKKQHEPVFDVIRAVSIAGIVLFHYSYTFYEFNILKRGPEFLLFSNGDYGEVFVAVFFMLSGSVLLYNYPSLRDKDHPSACGTLANVGSFYLKRWLSIFPMFYICWLVMYVLSSIHYGDWFWGGPKRNFLLSILGMDGYFLHWGHNYYCIGEWFIGGIVFMYLLYPLLLFVWNHAKIPGTLLIAFLFLFNLRRLYFSDLSSDSIPVRMIRYYNSRVTINDNRCIWTCLAAFYAGFILLTYILPFVNNLRGIRRAAFLFGVIAAIIPVMFFRLPLSKQEAGILLAFLVCILLMLLTPALTKFKPVHSLTGLISKYSYGIFLVHHVILYFIMKRIRGFVFTGFTSVLFFIPLFAFIMLISVVLTEMTGFITKKAVRSGKGSSGLSQTDRSGKIKQ